MTKSNTFLRRLLLADAAISGATGVLMLAAATLLERWLALPAPLLRSAGFSLLPFAALVLYLSRRDVLPRGGVWTVIALNFAWVIGSAVLLLAGGVEPNGLGYAFVIVQAIAVAGLAEMQYMGLRRVAV
jgi:hypothetical protein